MYYAIHSTIKSEKTKENAHDNLLKVSLLLGIGGSEKV